MAKPRVLACLAFAFLLSPVALHATPGPSELVVLLPPSADPPTVVGLINNGATLPYGLSAGNPTGARLVLPDRPIGRTLQWILTHPTSSLAMLHRYIVVEYPVPTDTAAVMATLQAGGQLQSVEPNVTLELSAAATTAAVTPNDPYFGVLLGDPEFSQWALHLMGFPAAWSWAKGHAQVGIVDVGIEPDHVELAPYAGTPALWQDGNFREHRSFNFSFSDSPMPNSECNPDEVEAGDVWAGHGTHVAGLVGALTNNGSGVAGACWNCSLQIGKAFEANSSVQGEISRAGRTAMRLVKQGAQLLNFSFGTARSNYGPCGPGSVLEMCQLLQLISERQVVVAAAAGNNRTTVNFPATEPSVIAVGGVKRTLASPYFDRWEESTCPYPNGSECGSNFGSSLDLVAPAKSVLSTLYKGWNHNPVILCGDLAGMPGIPGDGFGTCTGTSMSAPLVTGLAAIVRSVNPLLTHDEVADVLTSTATQASNRTDSLGYGLPQAEAAVLRALGPINNRQIQNRLTPLFSLASLANGIHFYTPAPQEASALTFDPLDPFDSFGPEVVGYSLPGACSTSPCPANPASAHFYVFSSDRSPFSNAPALRPLYRVRYDSARNAFCANGTILPESGRRFAYATTAAEINYFKNETVDGTGKGYDVDGLLGWIYPWCEPNTSCRPSGTAALYRLYNSAKDDWALVVEGDRATYEEAGYHSVQQVFAGVGFVDLNGDFDHDELIDGWERLLGTNPAIADTDCDGLSDGFEVRGYRSTGPPASHGFRDPLDGPCFPYFRDGFETGDTSRWSVTTGLDDGVGF